MVLEARLIQDSLLLADRQHIGVNAALAKIGSSSVVVLIWLRQPEFLCRFLLGRGWGCFYRLERRTDTALYPIDFPHRFYKRNAFNRYEIVQRGATGSFRFEVCPRTILCEGQRAVPFVAELSGSFRFEVVRLTQLHILVQIHLLRLGDFLLCYTGHTLPPYDVYDLELYESNGLAAVEPNALSGKYAFLSAYAVGDAENRYQFRCEQNELSTENGVDFHLTVTDTANPDREMNTPSRDQNSTVQAANSFNNRNTDAPQQPTAVPEIVSQPVKQQKKQLDQFSLLLDFMPVVLVGAVLFAVCRKHRR